MNKVILIGRLTRDPEVKYTQAAEPMAICKFTVAVDRPYSKNKDANERTADFINCTAFRNVGENIGKFFKKGNKIAVVGSIQTGEYTDQNGNRKFTTDVIVNEFDFCESRNNGITSNANVTKNTSNNNVNGNGNYRDTSAPTEDDDDEDLPF